MTVRAGGWGWLLLLGLLLVACSESDNTKSLMVDGVDGSLELSPIRCGTDGSCPETSAPWMRSASFTVESDHDLVWLEADVVGETCVNSTRAAIESGAWTVQTSGASGTVTVSLQATFADGGFEVYQVEQRLDVAIPSSSDARIAREAPPSADGEPMSEDPISVEVRGLDRSTSVWGSLVAHIEGKRHEIRLMNAGCSAGKQILSVLTDVLVPVEFLEPGIRLEARLMVDRIPQVAVPVTDRPFEWLALEQLPEATIVEGSAEAPPGVFRIECPGSARPDTRTADLGEPMAESIEEAIAHSWRDHRPERVFATGPRSVEPSLLQGGHTLISAYDVVFTRYDEPVLWVTVLATDTGRFVAVSTSQCR